MPSLLVSEIAKICDAAVEGDAERLITGANTMEAAQENDLAFAENQRHLSAVAASKAGCLLISPDLVGKPTQTLLRVAKPRLAFAKAVSILYQQPAPQPFLHPTASVDPSAVVSQDCHVSAHVSIGAYARIESGCFLGPGCTIGDSVKIGANSVLHANVTLYERVCLGERVVLHSGCVLGTDGFGFSFVSGHYEKFPQVGIVVIEDDVEIGANSCIDRAALGVTRIGKGTKLDNLVHVAHNCDIGQHVVVAAQTGFSGGATIGDYAVIGGQVGVGDKARIDAKAIVASKSGVLTGRRVEAGEAVWGIPARPLRQHLRNLAHVARLPRTHREIDELKERLKTLERRIGNSDEKS